MKNPIKLISSLINTFISNRKSYTTEYLVGEWINIDSYHPILSVTRDPKLDLDKIPYNIKRVVSVQQITPNKMHNIRNWLAEDNTAILFKVKNTSFKYDILNCKDTLYFEPATNKFMKFKNNTFIERTDVIEIDKNQLSPGPCYPVMYNK